MHGCDLFIKDNLVHLAEENNCDIAKFGSFVTADEMANILRKWEELPVEKRLVSGTVLMLDI